MKVPDGFELEALLAPRCTIVGYDFRWTGNFSFTGKYAIFKDGTIKLQVSYTRCTHPLFGKTTSEIVTGWVEDDGFREVYYGV